MKLIAMVLFTWTIPCIAQVPQAHIGDTRAAVIEKLGDPSHIYSARFGRTYPTSERNTALASAGFVSDVYTMVFSGMEFEVEVLYRFDGSASRLHQTERVERVTYTPDKNIHLAEVLRLLPGQDILCNGTCDMLGFSDGINYGLYLYPSSPSATQSETAIAVARGFALPGRDDGAFHWRPCMMVTFQEKPNFTDKGLPLLNSLTVDSVIEGVADPEFEKALSRGRYKEQKNLLPEPFSK